MRNSRSTWPQIALALILLLAALHAWHRAFLIDDGFISFRYARNLLEGLGLVYNAGERTEGYTNFLWTLIVAAAMRAGVEPGIAAQVLGILSSVATLFVLHRWGRDLGAGPWGALLAPGMLAVNRSFAAWATGGLETRFFTCLIVAAAWRLHAEIAFGERHGSGRGEEASGPREAVPVSAVLFATACLTRPEGYLAAGAGAVRLGTLLMRAPSERRRLAFFAGWLATIVVIAGTHLLWRRTYYGEWLPNSFYAKVPGLRFLSGGVYLWAFTREHLAPAAIAVAAVLAACLRRRDRAGTGATPRRGGLSSSGLRALAACVLPFLGAYLLYVAAVGGDHFEFRFVDPVLALAYLLSAMTLLASTSAAGAPVRWGLAFVLVGLAAWSSVAPFRDLDVRADGSNGTTYISISSVETESEYLRRWEKIGRWMKEHAAPEESIAVRPAGAIPYFSGLRTLDMLGINDHDIARLPARPGENVGHERQVEADYVVARGFTYLIASPEIRFERAREIPPNAVEVAFGDFWWYFWVLRPEARIRPGSYPAHGGPPGA